MKVDESIGLVSCVVGSLFGSLRSQALGLSNPRLLFGCTRLFFCLRDAVRSQSAPVLRPLYVVSTPHAAGKTRKWQAR